MQDPQASRHRSRGDLNADTPLAVRPAAPLLALLLPFFNTVLGRRWLSVLLPLTAPRVYLRAAHEHRALLLPGLAWAAWCTVTAAWAPHPIRTLIDVTLDLLLPMLAFLTMAIAARTPSDARRIGFSIYASLVGLSVLSLLVYKSGDLLVLYVKASRPGVLSLYPGPGFASTAVLLIAPLLLPILCRSGRWFAPLLLIGLGAVLATSAFSQNRAVWPVVALLGVAAAVLIRMRQPGKRVLPFAIGAALILGGLGGSALVAINQMRGGSVGSAALEQLTSMTKRDARAPAWRVWWRHGLQAPILGHGYSKRGLIDTLPQATRDELAALGGPLASHAHNVFLNVFVQTGALGLALALWQTCAHWKRWWKAYKAPDRMTSDVGVAGLLLLCALVFKNMTDDFLRDPITMLFWAYSGWLAGQQGGAAIEQTQHSVATANR